jgi:predicted nuclease of predicted toxin-antitoxin system
MKIKIDENLLVRIANGLNSLGHDAQTAQAEGLSGFADGVIWEAAQPEARLLITQDLDFSDVQRFAPERITEF